MRIVDAAVRGGELDLSLLKHHEAVKEQVQKIFERAQRLHPDLEVRLAKIERDEEHGCDALIFQTTFTGAPRETRFDYDYLSGPEWGELAALYAALDEVGPGPYRVETGRGDYEVRDVFEAVQVLRNDGAVP
jgi:DNA gyrase subunit B